MLGPAPKRVEICAFPSNKRLALTFSYDDGVVEDRRLIKFFNAHGLKGTFNLNSATFGHAGRAQSLETDARLDACEVAEVYQGHEVAIHTATHPHLPRLDASQIADEVLRDRQVLEDLVGYPVRGMAYPFGTYNPKVINILRALGIVYCRTVENADPCFPPIEPLAWPATMHHYGNQPSELPERFLKMYENPRAGGVFFIWGHSYEFARKNDWAALDRLFKPLAGKSDVWYCTNIELFDYEAARQRLVIAANRRTAFNPSALTVTLLADGKPIEVPPGQVVALAT